MTNLSSLSNSLLLSALLLTASIANAGETIKLKGEPVDHARLQAGAMSKDQPLLVKLFDTSHAKLGKAKHQDIARMLTGTAPLLLAADIVELLREAGFTNIILAESDSLPSGNYLILDGEFTFLSPGSQAARVWIGFGAGKSKICVKGTISNQAGEEAANFSDCTSGLGWGESGAQMDKSTDRVGHNIARLITDWADGSLK